MLYLDVFNSTSRVVPAIVEPIVSRQALGIHQLALIVVVFDVDQLVINFSSAFRCVERFGHYLWRCWAICWKLVLLFQVLFG